MGTFTVNLPDDLRTFVESQVAERNLADAGEYVSALIAADRAHTHLEALLLEGLNSGPAEEMTAADWEELHAEIARRFPEEPAGEPA
jgi:antitoxin ParD1/3/4